MTQTLERPPSSAAHMAARADARLQALDLAISQEQAKIDEAVWGLAENNAEKAKVVTLHEQLEAQRLSFQAELKNAQLLLDLSIGSTAQEQSEAALVQAQENLAKCEQTIAHDYSISQQYEVDHQAAAKRFRFDLQIAQSELERLQSERQTLLTIRADAWEKRGLETRDVLLGELEELLLKEQQVERMLERAKARRIAKQQSIAQRLVAWPELALSVEMEYGSHESSLRTSLLERWYSMVLEVEAHAKELQPDTLFLEMFINMAQVPIPPISAYGVRAQFSHKLWSEKPGPIATFVEYVSRLENLLNQWKSLDEKDAVASAMQRATNTPTL